MELLYFKCLNFQATILDNQLVQLKGQLTGDKSQFFSSQTMTKLHVA